MLTEKERLLRQKETLHSQISSINYSILVLIEKKANLNQEIRDIIAKEAKFIKWPEIPEGGIV